MPPLVEIGVNVTLVPAQILPVGLAVMLTEGTNTVFTVIGMPTLFTVALVIQLRLLVIVQVTISPLDNEVEE